MLTHNIATTLLLTAGVLAVDDQTVQVGNSTRPSQSICLGVVLTDASGNAGPTAISGSSAGVAIIGDKTYTAGGPAETSGGNTINAVLSDGVVYNDHTYSYTATATFLPSFGVGSTDNGNGTFALDNGHTLSVGGSVLVTEGHTVSAATNGLAIDGTVASVTVGDVEPTHLQTVTFESETLTASEISSGVFEVYTATLTAGGSAQTVLGQQISAASSGLVVATSTSSPLDSTTSSSTSGAEKLRTACRTGLVASAVLYSML